jgi:hypothetical protein
VLQKEPHAKHIVVEVEELLLRVDNDGEEGGLVEDVGLDNNMHHIGGRVGRRYLTLKLNVDT